MIHGVKKGCDPLSDAKRSKLYSTLTNMAYQRDFALMITKSLGWKRAIAELGGLEACRDKWLMWLLFDMKWRLVIA